MNNNQTQKLLIETLTETHQNAKTAYKKAIQQATTEQAEQIKKIANKFNITV